MYKWYLRLQMKDEMFLHMFYTCFVTSSVSDRRHPTRSASHLFVAEALVRVVQLVGEHLPVASKRLVPAQRDGGRSVRRHLQVGSGAGHLD